jgi:acylphosphatase
MKRARVIVSGRVQGVSFRWHTQARAEELGLSGWVRNLADGTVELEAEGPDDAVDALVAWCRRGPPAARVGDLQVEELAPTGGVGGFHITRG